MEGTCTLFNGKVIEIIEQKYAKDLGLKGSHHYYTVACPSCGALHTVEDKFIKKTNFTGLCRRCAPTKAIKEQCIMPIDAEPPIIQMNISEQAIQRITKKKSLATMTEKKCSRCKIVKPLEDFYMDNSRIDGISCACKQCDHKSRVATSVPVTKVCSQCKQTKPASDFHIRRMSHDGLMPTCKNCTLQSQTAARRKYTEINTKYIDSIRDVTKKKCARCGFTKPLKSFSINVELKDGHSIYCFDCTREMHLAQYNKYKNLPRPQYIDWRTTEAKRKHGLRQDLKVKVFTLYCPNGIIRCANPFHLHAEDVTDLDVLTVDHINGDGHVERQSDDCKSDFYRYLLKCNKRNDLQILCNNCQMKKSHIDHEYGKKNYLRELANNKAEE